MRNGPEAQAAKELRRGSSCISSRPEDRSCPIIESIILAANREHYGPLLRRVLETQNGPECLCEYNKTEKGVVGYLCIWCELRAELARLEGEK